MRRVLVLAALIAVALGGGACQSYDFIFQPDAIRRGAHLRFAVEQPSKADILFVVDNSKSMAEEQLALANSIGDLLEALAPNDTSYRIGIVSTDVNGYTEDCLGNPLVVPDPSWLPGARGNCERPEVELRRPHDGVAGRLMAAFDPEAFQASLYGELGTNEQAVFTSLTPTDVDQGPTNAIGQRGVPWVIDRDLVQGEACAACNCPCDDEEAVCFTDCARDVATALVKAYFRSNIAGLGIRGSGYEQGIKASLLSIGVDPDQTNDEDALNPPARYDLTKTHNTHGTLEGESVVTGPWFRPEAVLGIMVVSDEQDCSMPYRNYESIGPYEEPTLPVGSVCYQQEPQDLLMINTTTVARLLRTKKRSGARVAVGFIGGAQPTGPADRPRLRGEAVDCFMTGAGQASSQCACLYNELDERWCYLSNLSQTNLDRCQALSGTRYVELASSFGRRTIDSICQSNFGPALEEFADVITSACFDLDEGVQPANRDPDNIKVLRTSREDAEAGIAPSLLTRVSAEDLGPGWYFDMGHGDDPAKICLVGLDRLIGDVYDIFVLTTDIVDYTR